MYVHFYKNKINVRDIIEDYFLKYGLIFFHLELGYFGLECIGFGRRNFF